jgi:pyruvate ferredoxin oxidoreductase delta subunit
MACKNIYFKGEGPWSDADQLLLYLDTGSWRSKRPVVIVEECIYCGLCALFCPTQCMISKDESFEPNLEYCKGCGVCAKECPRKAISMEPEEGFNDE